MRQRQLCRRERLYEEALEGVVVDRRQKLEGEEGEVEDRMHLTAGVMAEEEGRPMKELGERVARTRVAKAEAAEGPSLGSRRRSGLAIVEVAEAEEFPLAPKNLEEAVEVVRRFLVVVERVLGLMRCVFLRRGAGQRIDLTGERLVLRWVLLLVVEEEEGLGWSG